MPASRDPRIAPVGVRHTDAITVEALFGVYWSATRSPRLRFGKRKGTVLRRLAARVRCRRPEPFRSLPRCPWRPLLPARDPAGDSSILRGTGCHGGLPMVLGVGGRIAAAAIPEHVPASLDLVQDRDPILRPDICVRWRERPRTRSSRVAPTATH
jgi:hypothetical protein